MPIQAKCGSESGYNKHKRKGEQPCDACRQAYRDATRKRKAKQRANDKGKASSGAPTMYTIEDHEIIIKSLTRSIEILESAIETEEVKSNRNLSGLTRSLADLHEKVATHKAAIREIQAQEALDNEEESEVSNDPFDIFARELHNLTVSKSEDSQDLSTSDEESSKAGTDLS